MSSGREDLIREVFKQTGTDKLHHNYPPVYVDIPETIKTVFEIGIDRGYSLLAWAELFPNAEIYGVDSDKIRLLDGPMERYERIQNHPRIHMLQANIQQFDPGWLPYGIDLIIDDCSHALGDILTAWDKLYDRLSGTYVIEDIQYPLLNPIWERVTKTFPDAITSFWRTSKFGGSTAAGWPDTDSQCLKVKL